MLQELTSYMGTASDPPLRELPTRCPPWTVHDLTAHLAETFARFNRMLERGRTEDLRPPFARDDLPRLNLEAVARFEGDALARLRAEATSFIGAVTDLTELMPHQFGPIPVGLQVLFGLNELAIHHDDAAAAAGGGYRPPEAVVEALVPVWERALTGLPDERDSWRAIIRASGRTPGEANA